MAQDNAYKAKVVTLRMRVERTPVTTKSGERKWLYDANVKRYDSSGFMASSVEEQATSIPDLGHYIKTVLSDPDNQELTSIHISMG